MEDEIHDDIDAESCACHYEHDLWILDELLVDDAHSRLVEQEDRDTPDNEEIGEGTDNFHTVETERVLGVGGPVTVVQEHKAHDEAYQVRDQVCSVRNYRNRVGNHTSQNLTSDEDDAHHDDNNQLTVVLGVVYLLWDAVQVLFTLTLFHLYSELSRSLSLFNPKI
jgi:hypothetical protein